MSRLTGALRSLGTRRGDRGAVAALVAVLLAGGVLLGMGALVVDVGLLYAEREELQSGADAASVAVARVCVGRNDQCSLPAMNATADGFAGDNAKDGFADAAVCGRVPVTGVSNRIRDCGASPTNLTACLGDRPANPVPYVEVYSTTHTAAGGTLLPPAFAGAVTGTNGATVGACSRVSWGPVLTADTGLAIGISHSGFNSGTRNGAVFQPPPVNGRHDPDVDQRREVALGWRPGRTGAGNGFIWLKSSGASPCAQLLEVGARVTGTTTRRTPTGCAAALRTLLANPQPVPVAIFDSGSSGAVDTVGIAMFVVTGWFQPARWSGGPGPFRRSSSEPSSLSRRDWCKGGRNFCIYGYFTTKVFRLPSNPAPLSADHYGAVYLRTIG